MFRLLLSSCLVLYAIAAPTGQTAGASVSGFVPNDLVEKMKDVKDEDVKMMAELIVKHKDTIATDDSAFLAELKGKAPTLYEIVAAHSASTKDKYNALGDEAKVFFNKVKVYSYDFVVKAFSKQVSYSDVINFTKKLHAAYSALSEEAKTQFKEHFPGESKAFDLDPKIVEALNSMN